MGIYELSQQSFEVYNKRYLLSANVYSEYGLQHYSEDDVISDLNEGYFEKLFDTQLEAYLSAKLVSARVEIDRLNDIFEQLKSVQTVEFSW